MLILQSGSPIQNSVAGEIMVCPITLSTYGLYCVIPEETN